MLKSLITISTFLMLLISCDLVPPTQAEAEDAYYAAFGGAVYAVLDNAHTSISDGTTTTITIANYSLSGAPGGYTSVSATLVQGPTENAYSFTLSGGRIETIEVRLNPPAPISNGVEIDFSANDHSFTLTHDETRAAY